MSKIDLVLIDPQNDFCDSTNGTLFVPGANLDMERAAKFIRTHVKRFNDIHITLDSHQPIHIADSYVWQDSNGKNPPYFTIITAEDVEKGIWNPVNLRLRNKFLNYVKELDNNGRYKLCIWPPHCKIGTWGASIFPELSNALNEWAIQEFATLDVVIKGSNPFTEHYSAVKADVIDQKDPQTNLNMSFIKTLSEADEILFGGEALSHCLASTGTDIADNFGEENIRKMVLLTDLTSSVPGFEHLGEEFIKKMKSRGMKVTTSVDYF